MDLYHLLFFAAFLTISANPVPDTSLVPSLSDSILAKGPADWNFDQTNLVDSVQQYQPGLIQDDAVGEIQPVYQKYNNHASSYLDTPETDDKLEKKKKDQPTLGLPGWVPESPLLEKECDPPLPAKACCPDGGVGYWISEFENLGQVFDVPSCISCLSLSQNQKSHSY